MIRNIKLSLHQITKSSHKKHSIKNTTENIASDPSPYKRKPTQHTAKFFIGVKSTCTIQKQLLAIHVSAFPIYDFIKLS